MKILLLVFELLFSCLFGNQLEDSLDAFNEGVYLITYSMGLWHQTGNKVVETPRELTERDLANGMYQILEWID